MNLLYGIFVGLDQAAHVRDQEDVQVLRHRLFQLVELLALGAALDGAAVELERAAAVLPGISADAVGTSLHHAVGALSMLAELPANTVTAKAMDDDTPTVWEERPGNECFYESSIPLHAQCC